MSLYSSSWLLVVSCSSAAPPSRSAIGRLNHIVWELFARIRSWVIYCWSIDWIVKWSSTLLWALSIMFYYCQCLTQCRIVHLAQALEDYILDFGAYMGGVFWKLLLRYPLHCIHTNRQCRTAEEVRVSSGDRTVRTSPANSIQSCTFTSELVNPRIYRLSAVYLWSDEWLFWVLATSEYNGELSYKFGSVEVLFSGNFVRLSIDNANWYR